MVTIERKKMRLFDSHCHLDDNAFDRDLDQVLARAKKNGVESAMIVGITEESSRKAVRIAGERKGLYASVGVHPHDSKHCAEEMIGRLQHLAKEPCVRSWGETGLDFNRMFSPREMQETCFARQLEAAAESELPFILHERDSGGRLLEILRSHGDFSKGGVVHCFSGSRSELAAYLDLGLCIGITGIVTVQGRGAELRQMVASIPSDRLLIETDAPYLTPVPERNRHRRNEPAFVRSCLLKLAEVRKEDPEVLAGKIWENTCRLFNIDS